MYLLHIFSFITSLRGYGLESTLSFRLVIFLYLENICQLLPSRYRTRLCWKYSYTWSFLPVLSLVQAQCFPLLYPYHLCVSIVPNKAQSLLLQRQIIQDFGTSRRSSCQPPSAGTSHPKFALLCVDFLIWTKAGDEMMHKNKQTRWPVSALHQDLICIHVQIKPLLFPNSSALCAAQAVFAM